ncbi:MAG TPA: hypothetical protein VMP08_24795 [Anaerolineae bacterium]|nr:hypothetical protein [Anaerolineae bacterium]
MNEANQPANWIRRSRRLIFVLALIVFAAALFSLYLLYTEKQDTENQAKPAREQAEKLLAHPMPLPAIIAGVRPRPGSRDETVDEVCVFLWLNMPPPPSPLTKDFATTIATLSIDGLPMSSYSSIYPTMPTHQCWGGDFKGLHLAEVTFQSALSGTLSYQWAFVGH